MGTKYFEAEQCKLRMHLGNNKAVFSLDNSR